MTTQSVQYRSCVRLYCGVDLPTEVILCVPSELVVQLNPPDITSTIAAVMETEVCTPAAGCTAAYWTYTFTYDGDQLIAGAVLTGEMITGVICENCFTTWVREQAALVQCDLTASDSSTVEFALTPGPCQMITADVQVSADAGNAITVEPDGLYVAPADVQAGYANLCIDYSVTTYPGAGAQVLKSCEIPANTLAVNGDRLEVQVFGSIADNANDKRITVRFGGFVTSVDTSTFVDALKVWRLYMSIVRTGAATQLGMWSFEMANGGPDPTAQMTGGFARFAGTADLTAIADLEILVEADAAGDVDILYFLVDKVLA